MRTNSTARLVLAALLCALTAVLSQIQIPLPPVPVSLSLLGVHLCAALLPWRLSASAMGAYVLLGACGVPVFAGFAAGPSVLLGPTGGFLFGYILCAALESAMITRLRFTRRALTACMAAGTAACYGCGLVWFSISTGSGLTQSLSVCVIPFLPGDILKIVFAASIAIRLQKTLSVSGVSVHSS